jgi:hypothetical protein
MSMSLTLEGRRGSVYEQNSVEIGIPHYDGFGSYGNKFCVRASRVDSCFVQPVPIASAQVFFLGSTLLDLPERFSGSRGSSVCHAV